MYNKNTKKIIKVLYFLHVQEEYEEEYLKSIGQVNKDTVEFIIRK